MCCRNAASHRRICNQAILPQGRFPLRQYFLLSFLSRLWYPVFDRFSTPGPTGAAVAGIAAVRSVQPYSKYKMEGSLL